MKMGGVELWVLGRLEPRPDGAPRGSNNNNP